MHSLIILVGYDSNAGHAPVPLPALQKEQRKGG